MPAKVFCLRQRCHGSAVQCGIILGTASLKSYRDSANVWKLLRLQCGIWVNLMK